MKGIPYCEGTAANAGLVAALKLYDNAYIERYNMGWNDPRAAFEGSDPPDKTIRKILSGVLPPEDRVGAINAVIRRDYYMASAGHSLHMRKDDVTSDDNIYRVSLFPDGIDVMCFGLSSIDSNVDGHYDISDDLPEWVKERLAVLMILSSTPPTSEVAGVGRRISSHVYWVYAPTITS